MDKAGITHPTLRYRNKNHIANDEEPNDMIKIAILEDQSEQAEHLLSLLKRYGEEHADFSYAVQHYDRSIALLSEYNCDADMLLLDIQMPDMLGIDVAKKIREIDSRVMIIFITTLTQYAIEGYSVGAFDYVVKPVRYDAFAAKLDRACRMLAYQHLKKTIDVRTKEEVRRLSVDEILYIEVVNHDVLIHTDTKVYTQWGSLKTYEEMLRDEHFVRCNSCYLVNLKYVHGINGDSVLVHHDELAISKPKRRDFLVAVAQYKGGSR